MCGQSTSRIKMTILHVRLIFYLILKHCVPIMNSKTYVLGEAQEAGTPEWTCSRSGSKLSWLQLQTAVTLGSGLADSKEWRPQIQELSTPTNAIRENNRNPRRVGIFKRGLLFKWQELCVWSCYRQWKQKWVGNKKVTFLLAYRWPMSPQHHQAITS